MSDYRTEAPQVLRDFLSYHETIKAHSKRTVDEYFLDLRNFFRYMKQIRDPALSGKALDEIVIMEIEPVDEENENYLAVEDEAVLDAVYGIFKEKFKDVLTFED